MRFARIFLIAATALMLACAPALAQPTDPRTAVQRGEALPLRQILARVLPHHPGRLLNADLMRDSRGQLVYRLRILEDDGKV
ncbi:MAG: peptidase, partial [Rhodospirillaceae bacterium]